MRIAICTNFVSPYRVPVFEEIASAPGVDLGVFVSCSTEFDREWRAENDSPRGFDVKKSVSVSRKRRVVQNGDHGFEQLVEQHMPIGLPADLMRFRPDVIVSGELGVRTMLAMAAGRVLRVPVIPWTYHPAAQAGQLLEGGAIRAWIARRAPAIIGMGRQARSVLEQAGCEEKLIFDAPNAAPMARIAQRLSSSEHCSAVRSIRRRFAGRRIAVLVGRPVPMKGYAQLIDAWLDIPADVRDKWVLVHVGSLPDGVMRRRFAEAGVVCAGHAEPDRMPDWFAAADLHVFSSLGDPWGLVVNEAMQCGTPTLCSVRAGCCDDLVRDGLNGFVYDPLGSHEAAVRSLLGALNSTRLAELGAQARLDIQQYSPARMAHGFIRAAEFVTSTTPVDAQEAAA